MYDPQYLAEVINLPAGLDACILKILAAFHEGRDKAIGRKDLLRKVSRMMGQTVNERSMREVIKKLRREGHLICAAAGRGGGYFIAVDPEEYEAFERTEYLGKIADMQETLSAMRKAAKEKWHLRTSKPKKWEKYQSTFF